MPRPCRRFTPFHNCMQELLSFLTYGVWALAQVFSIKIWFYFMNYFHVLSHSFPHIRLFKLPRLGIGVPVLQMRRLKPVVPKPSSGFGCRPSPGTTTLRVFPGLWMDGGIIPHGGRGRPGAAGQLEQSQGFGFPVLARVPSGCLTVNSSGCICKTPESNSQSG